MAMANARFSDGFSSERRKNQRVQNTRTAVIPIPSTLEIDCYVVSATFVTEDTDDASRHKPFFPCISERTLDGITVVASRRREDANTSNYVCEYIVVAAAKR